MVKYLLMKNIHIHSLNLLSFVYIVVSDAKAALENAKLAILERLELHIFFVHSHPWWESDEKIFRWFTKLKTPSMLLLIFNTVIIFINYCIDFEDAVVS